MSRQAGQTRLRVALIESAMSQPFADISITNHGTRACVLSGYPQITLTGRPGRSRKEVHAAPVEITVRHRIYERVDLGPHPIVVRPRQQVFFSIGTATAYDGPSVTLTRLTVVLPGTVSPTTIPLRLPASSPLGRKMPVGVTAIQRVPHA